MRYLIFRIWLTSSAAFLAASAVMNELIEPTTLFYVSGPVAIISMIGWIWFRKDKKQVLNG